MSNLIEKLKKEIAEQTKEHEDYVSIDVNDLNELGYGIDPKKTGKADVDPAYLKIAIERYEFRGRVKVERKQQTFKELEAEIKNIEREK